MRFEFHPPAEQEIVGDAPAMIVFQPAVLKGVHTIKMGYLVATGEGGMESKAAILFNSRTGQFSVQNLDDTEAPKLMFDLPKQEFEAKRATQRKAGLRAAKRLRNNRREADSDAPAPTD